MGTRKSVIPGAALGAALLAALLLAPAASEAATFGKKCVISGEVRPEIAAAINAQSQNDLVGLLSSDPGYAADVMLAARSASPEAKQLLGVSLARARLTLLSNGNENGARFLAAASACGDKALRDAQADAFRFILVKGVAPDYVVPLFYDNFGGGIVSPN